MSLPTLQDVQNLGPTSGDGLAQWQQANGRMSHQWIISISYGDYAPETNAFVLPVIQAVVPLRTRGWGRKGGYCIDFLVTCRVSQVGNTLRTAIEAVLTNFWRLRNRVTRNVVVSSVENYKKKMTRLYEPTRPNSVWIGPTSAPTPTAFVAPTGSGLGVNTVIGSSGTSQPAIPTPPMVGTSQPTVPMHPAIGTPGTPQPGIPNPAFPSTPSCGSVLLNQPSTSWAPSTYPFPPHYAPPNYFNQQVQQHALPLPHSSALSPAFQTGGGAGPESEPSGSRKRKSIHKKKEATKKPKTDISSENRNIANTSENSSGENANAQTEPQTSDAPQPSTSGTQSQLPSFVDKNCERCVLFFTLGRDSTRAHAQTCRNYKPRKQRVSKKNTEQKPEEKKNAD